MPSATLKVGLAQIAPVWLDRERTLAKVIAWCERAAAKGCALVAFGEALLPGYPFWLERTGGARFNAPDQKALFARYLDQAVAPEAGHLDPLREVAADRGLMVVLGTVERAADRGGHSLYCTLMIIGADGALLSAHRKLMPTYEERLVWSTGDGHGLQTHRLDPFTVGALNCWENWMPLPRAALYGLGEDLHVALWPGALRNTCDITRYLALEGRSYVLSVSGLLRPADIPEDIPERGRILAGGEPFLADGGSCLAGPDGSWVLEPLVAEEALRVAEIDHGRVLEERQNFDPAGHYSRPDVTRLVLDRRRQRTVEDA
ncbi:MAG: carbon-nitrogen hydrolase family protein [Truepera sp.]|nr:carbon-nitrogen hydrolase family protein [Truepera sp.]